MIILGDTQYKIKLLARQYYVWLQEKAFLQRTVSPVVYSFFSRCSQFFMWSTSSSDFFLFLIFAYALYVTSAFQMSWYSDILE